MPWPSFKKKPVKKSAPVNDQYSADSFAVSKAIRKIVNQLVIIEYDQAVARFIEPPLPAHFKQLQNICSYFTEGAQFTSAFQKGYWNGRKYLLNSKGVFHTGLLFRMEKWLRQTGYKVKLQEKHTEPIGKIKLQKVKIAHARDYQEMSVESFLKNRRGIIQVATGGGKTLIAAMAIARIQEPTIFMVHTKDLLYQAQQMLADALDEKIGIIGDGQFAPENITVTMIQTIAEYFHYEVELEDDEDQELVGESVDLSDKLSEMKRVMESAGFLIMDEVHRVAAPTFLTTMSHISNAKWRLGLSASPWRDDGANMALEAAFGPIVCRVSASDLIRRGYLVAPVIRFHEIQSTRRQVIGTDEKGKQKLEPYMSYYKRVIVLNQARNEQIRDIVLRSMNRKGTPASILILVRYISHGNTLLNLIRPTGVAVSFLNGQDPSEYRKKVIQWTREGKIQVLIATSLADEGLDIPRLNTLVLAGCGKSSTKALQRIGRVLRIFKDKDTAEVHEFLDHAEWFYNHAQKRMEMYETEPEFSIV